MAENAGSEVAERPTARVVLLDRADRILLMKGRLPSRPGGPGYWFAVWTAGAFDVTLKVEYLHAGFETKQYFPPNLLTPIRDTKLTDDIIRAGVNVKFNWGPVVARY